MLHSYIVGKVTLNLTRLKVILNLRSMGDRVTKLPG